jgi:hypothetical protein
LTLFQELSKRSLWVPGMTRPQPVRRRPHAFHMQSWGTDKDGNILWSEPWIDNILHDEGEIYILSAAFDTDLSGYGAPPANLYLGLDNRTTPAEADTLASLSGETSGNGYARVALPTTTGFTIAANAPYNQATSNTAVFTSTGTIGPAKNRFLCTHITATTSGTGQRLIASVALASTRTLNNTDVLNTNIVLQLD